MNLTLISTIQDGKTMMYVVEPQTANMKISADPDSWVFMPVNDEKIVSYFVGLYCDIITSQSVAGRRGSFFRMLAVQDEWYLAEIELSDEKIDYPGVE